MLSPVFGDPIIGYITRGRGVTVHRKNCHTVNRIRDTERLIAVDWIDKNVDECYSVGILVTAVDRRALASDITHVIAKENINIGDLDVKTNSKENTAFIYLILQVHDLFQLKKVMDKIEQLPNIMNVTRYR